MNDGFDPTTHDVMPQRGFDELEVGEVFRMPSRTMTEALFAAFQTASGDNHPIHYDVEYCKRHGHPGLLAHGYQVMIQACAGAGPFPHVIGDALVGFLEASASWKKPVYAGDTVYPALEITELKRQNTTGVVTVRATVHNQKGELVMDGEQKYLLRLAAKD